MKYLSKITLFVFLILAGAAKGVCNSSAWTKSPKAHMEFHLANPNTIIITTDQRIFITTLTYPSPIACIEVTEDHPYGSTLKITFSNGQITIEHIRRPRSTGARF